MPRSCRSIQLVSHLGAWLLGLTATTCQADDFYLLSGNRSALDVRLELIALAQQEINLAYYAVDSGDVSLTLMGHLRQAARRGVRVRVLVDGLRSRLPDDFTGLLIRDGLELRAYHPPLKRRPAWLNRRLHHKLMIVDNRAMIVGSRNLEDAHFGLDTNNFVDTDALMTGDICQQAAEHFEHLWNSDEVFSVDASYTFSWPKKREAADDHQFLEAAQRIMNRDDFVDLLPAGCLDPCVEHLGCSQLVHDRGTDKRPRHFQTEVIAILDSAHTQLWIQSPYPVLEQPVKDALQRAVHRGVQVTLLTNSLGTSNVKATYAAYQNDKREFQRMGIRLVEYTGSGTLHSKLILVDDQASLLSSYNMDARSDRLNLEFGVWITDPRVNQLLKQEFQQRMLQSETVAPTRQTFPPVIHGEASLRQRSQMRLQQLLVPLIRSSL